MDRYFDIAVIGAGPAGSSCANALLLNGVKSIALIDSSTFPRDKVCGDGIGPGAVQMLGLLELDDFLKDHKPIRYLGVSGPSGVHAKGILPPVGGAIPTGYSIPRIEYDNHIFQAAIARGAVDFSGYSLSKAEFDGDNWQLVLQHSQTRKLLSFKAKILVGADGARSKVRQVLGVQKNSDRHTGIGARIYGNSPSAHFDALQIDFTKKLLPAYGWLFPSSNSKANIGVGIDLDNYKRGNLHLKEIMEDYRDSLGTNITYESESYQSFILPYGSEMPKLAYIDMNAALIGDAGSMINPLTGEGIYYGMFAGELLGRLLAPAVLENSRYQIEDALLGFQSGFTKKFGRHFQLNWTMKEKVENEDWCNMVITACSRDRVVLSALIDLMMGDKQDIEIGTMFRIFARNFLPFLP